jgi:hypothetical protein
MHDTYQDRRHTCGDGDVDGLGLGRGQGGEEGRQRGLRGGLGSQGGSRGRALWQEAGRTAQHLRLASGCGREGGVLQRAQHRRAPPLRPHGSKGSAAWGPYGALDAPRRQSRRRSGSCWPSSWRGRRRECRRRSRPRRTRRRSARWPSAARMPSAARPPGCSAPGLRGRDRRFAGETGGLRHGEARDGRNRGRARRRERPRKPAGRPTNQAEGATPRRARRSSLSQNDVRLPAPFGRAARRATHGSALRVQVREDRQTDRHRARTPGAPAARRPRTRPSARRPRGAPARPRCARRGPACGWP